MLDDAVGWGVDAIFGKGTYERYNEREAAALKGTLGFGLTGAHAGTTQHTSAIDLINRARPGTAATSVPAAGAAAGPVNSNNTQTVNVGGISVTVNATGGDAAVGQSVAGAIAERLRAFLTHSAGPGEGTTSAPAAVGSHS